MLDLTKKTLLSALLVLGATAVAGCDDTLVFQDTPAGEKAYALLRPLPPGDHVLEFGGTTYNATGGVQFTTSAVHELHVAEPGHSGHDDE